MNKKIKVIDLFRMKKFPKKIIFKESVFVFKDKNKSIEHLYEIDDFHICLGWLEKEDISLNDEVEILEDNTEEIEEYTTIFTESSKDIEVREKINELVKAVNKLRKEKE